MQCTLKSCLWVAVISLARTQPIVGNATADMLGMYFLPVSERLLEQAFAVQSLERRLGELITLKNKEPL